jgi:hypothetical protein
MKITELPSILCKKEGKLKQVSVGNMREIISILSDLLYADELCIFANNKADQLPLYNALLKNGQRRAKKAKAKKKK